MLKELSASTHEVITAVTVRDAHRLVTKDDTAIVHFKELTDEEIEKVTGGVSDVVLEYYRREYGQSDGSFLIPCGSCDKVFRGTDLDQLLDELAAHVSADHPIHIDIDPHPANPYAGR